MGKRVGLVLNMSTCPIYAIGVAVLLLSMAEQKGILAGEKPAVWSVVGS